MACEVVFTREELASSSLTGKRSNAFKDAAEKPQLDKNKVSAVVGKYQHTCRYLAVSLEFENRNKVI